jgi:hypothetical protein
MNARELVEKAEVNKRVEFPESFPLEYVHFDLRDYGNEYDEYSWSSKKRGEWRHIFAFGRSSNTVGTFKTLAGAKRNFLKQFNHYFEAS